MFVVSPDKIVSYTRCPNLCLFSWNKKKKVSPETKVIRDAIKLGYIYHSQTNKVVPWRRFIGWTERLIAENLPELSTTEESYKRTKNFLSQLSKWYNDFYLPEYCDPAYTNLPITIGLGSRVTYSDEIDLVTVGDKIRIFDFEGVYDGKQVISYNGLKVYNDLLVWVRIWGLWRAAYIEPKEYIRVLVTPRSIKPVRITILKSMLERSEKIVRQATKGIEDEVYYPVFSSQCIRCSYREGCSM